MAVCEICKREMTVANGCVETVLVLGKQRISPVRYAGGWGADGRCHDCNCKEGEFHHLGCDVERCPVCGCQAISCGCLDEAEVLLV